MFYSMLILALFHHNLWKYNRSWSKGLAMTSWGLRQWHGSSTLTQVLFAILKKLLQEIYVFLNAFFVTFTCFYVNNDNKDNIKTLVVTSNITLKNRNKKTYVIKNMRIF